MASQWKNVHEILTPSAATAELLYTATWNETLTITASNNWADTAVWVYTVPAWWSVWDSNMFISWYTLVATDLRIIWWWLTPKYWEKIYVKSTSWDVIFHLLWDKP